MPKDDFFVGYRTMSKRMTRFSLVSGLLFLVLAASVAAASGAFRRGAGHGLERNRSGQQFVGLIVSDPYATLRYYDPERDQVRHLLLVRSGKFGATEQAAAFVGQVVRVKGLLLEREHEQMLELHARIEPDDSLNETQRARLRDLPTEALGNVTLRGEIVDSKCFLGRMRPGGGRTHRACAQLCLSGGIPPVLLTRDAEGKATYYVLSTRDHEAMQETVIPYAAEQVEISGELERSADLLFVRTDASSIHRL